MMMIMITATFHLMRRSCLGNVISSHVSPFAISRGAPTPKQNRKKRTLASRKSIRPGREMTDAEQWCSENNPGDKKGHVTRPPPASAFTRAPVLIDRQFDIGVESVLRGTPITLRKVLSTSDERVYGLSHEIERKGEKRHRGSLRCDAHTEQRNRNMRQLDARNHI